MKKIEKLIEKINEIREKESKTFCEAVSLMPALIDPEQVAPVNKKYARMANKVREKMARKILVEYDGHIFEEDDTRVYNALKESYPTETIEEACGNE